jgi:glycerol dehydrogenase
MHDSSLRDEGTRRLRAPANYLQGPDVFDDASALLAATGERAVVFGGETALTAVGEDLRGALDSAGVDVAATERGVDRATPDAVARYADTVAEAAADVVVAVGGGKAIDAAKAAANEAGAAVVTVPTVASTNAASSTVSVLYDGAGRVVDNVYRDCDPELVLVDTSVVAAAPARFLRYGMGDAFATRFEAEATARSGGSVDDAGRRPTMAATAIARGVYDNLAAYGPDALAAARRGDRTAALEAVVETVVVQSAIGFESGGLAAAHAFHQGFREVGVTDAHGVVVAFGTLAELVLEDHDDLADALDTYLSLDLDVTLAEMGVDDGEVDAVAEAACGRPLMANEPVDVTPDRAAAALRRADELVAARRD